MEQVGHYGTHPDLVNEQEAIKVELEAYRLIVGPTLLEKLQSLEYAVAERDQIIEELEGRVTVLTAKLQMDEHE